VYITSGSVSENWVFLDLFRRLEDNSYISHSFTTMVHLAALTPILLVVAKAAAQSAPTISFLQPWETYFSSSITEVGYASIVAVNPTGTVLAQRCEPSRESTTTCDFTDYVTFTVGPSTFEGRQTDSFTYFWHCDYTGITRAVCESTGGASGTTQAITNTYSSLIYVTVQVTAGADKLPSTTAGKTTAAGTPSATITSGTATQSATGTGAAGPSKGSGAHMSPSKGGIVAAFLLWGLFG